MAKRPIGDLLGEIHRIRTNKDFRQLRERIEREEFEDKNSIFTARSTWFGYGLGCFDEDFISPMVRSAENAPAMEFDDPDYLVMKWEEICEYLNPEYLGTSAYESMRELLVVMVRRLIEAVGETTYLGTKWSGRLRDLVPAAA